MKKIIEPGKYQVVTCTICKSKFSYEDEDIIWGNGRFPSKEVECPYCQNCIDLHKIRVRGTKE